VKYGPQGQTVTMGSAERSENVRVYVSDEGPGVPAAERDTIWQAFERGAAGQQSGEGGSGIGLSVVRDLAEQYGGKAWVESAPNDGARFVVEFARAAESAARRIAS
jgi:two-component system, OmpR family, sensor kinase